MKHKTITLILNAPLDIEDFRFTSSLKHLYTETSFFRSSLSHIYYSLLYSVSTLPLPYFLVDVSFRVHSLALSNESSCSQEPQVWVLLAEPDGEHGEWEMKTHRHTDIKTRSWVQEDCTFLVGYMNAYMSQSVYFICQYKEMTQIKIKLQQFFDLR
jgi:hypothetical protein